MLSSKTVVTVAILSIVIGSLSIRYTRKRGHGRNDITIATEVNEEYDYVIIGGGSAGSVVAGRLAEDEHTSVLVLESGGDFQDNSDFYIPAKWANLLGSKYDWSYKTEPQEHAFHGMKGRQGAWSRGQVLGGSGSINLLQYTRGSSFDFDEWESTGCDGWGYKDVLPYFLKSEDVLIDDLKDSKYHQEGGKLAVTEVDATPLGKLFRDAGKELGFDLDDYNGQRQHVVSRLQINTRNGERSSAAIEYLKYNGDNLHISVNSHVTKINVEKKTATGVFYVKDNRKRYVLAKKEVILSAGAINSPQILLLSGIGPENQLQEFGIPMVADLPVGENLQDHQQIAACVNINTSGSLTEEKRESLTSFLEYALFGTGPLSIAGSDGNLFFHLDETKKDTSYPDIHFVFYPALIADLKLNFEDHVAKELFKRDPNENGFCTFIALTHPRARGSIKLRSSDPFDHPSIDPQYFADHLDVEDLVKAIRVWEKLVQSESFKGVGVNIQSMKMSFCSQFEFRSDDYWKCYIRHTAFTQFHPTSSCKMGSLNKSETVVGPDLKVKGVRNLRVVDASIFPKVTSGNTNAPTIMIGEKAADMIKSST